MNFEEYSMANDQALRGISRSDLSVIEGIFLEARSRGALVVFFGNGGSAASATHAVGDFTKTAKAGRNSGGIRSMSFSDSLSLFTAYSNDFSFEDAGAHMLEDFAGEGDVLVLISVSGSSPNLINAARAARDLGVTVITLVGQNGSSLVDVSDAALLVPSSDYQIVENAHMSLIHYFTKVLQEG